MEKGALNSEKREASTPCCCVIYCQILQYFAVKRADGFKIDLFMGKRRNEMVSRVL